MQLPYRDSVYVPRTKILNYLLSQTHAVGKPKAMLFRQFGFDETNIPELEKGLKKIAQENDITEKISNQYGEKYVIDGILNTPDGRILAIKTIWIIENGENKPRFVTAFPS